MAIEVRALADDEHDAFVDTLTLAFGWEVDEEDAAHAARYQDHDRRIGAFDGTELVGTCGSYRFAVSTPGGSSPAAGTTQVSVKPSHRRQGILRSLMTEHFEDIRRNGEPLAALWASESSIYGRFGYGVAADECHIQIDRRYTTMSDGARDEGEVRLVDVATAGTILPDLYREASDQRPGMMSRSAAWWEHRRLLDRPDHREGASPYRYAVYVGEDGRPAGYAQYRVKPAWTDSHPDATLTVTEMVGLHGSAERALWSFLFGVDLVTTIQAHHRPVDDLLPWLLAEPSRARRTLDPGLWVRIMDVPAALEARRYAADGRIVVSVADALCPWNEGSWSVHVDGGVAQVEPTGDEPDVAMPVATLAMLYLGGRSVRGLVAAGLLAGADDRLARLGETFRWDPAPWCPELF